MRSLRALVVVAVVAAVSFAAPFVGPTAQAAPPSSACVNGWTAPPPGSAEYDQGLGILAGFFGITGGIEVAEIRYFTGPDSPGIIEPRLDVVPRWYLKVTQVDDPTWRGRFIVEFRTDVINSVSAAAPFDTTGYRSPDWRAFEGDGDPRSIPGLPGLWSGLEFDFVTGEGDGGNRGLPPEVEGCLSEPLPTTR